MLTNIKIGDIVTSTEPEEIFLILDSYPGISSKNEFYDCFIIKSPLSFETNRCLIHSKYYIETYFTKLC